jgi:hypothetical protein
VGGRDEGAIAARAREDDVARLVADEQRADHARRRRREIDDADAVREVVHDPRLGVAARRDRDGLHADRHGALMRDPAGADGEDLEPVVGDVADDELRAVGSQRERAHGAALELEEGRSLRARRAREREQQQA